MDFFGIFLIGGLNVLHWEAFKAICRMAYFDLSSESHFEVRSFLTRITCSLLVQYSRNELLKHMVLTIFLEKDHLQGRIWWIMLFWYPKPMKFWWKLQKNWFKFKEFEYKIDYNWWHILTYFLTVYGWMFRGSPTDH